MMTVKKMDSEKKAQYRFDPFLHEWIVYSPSRSKRPFQGKQFTQETPRTWTCPFCPDAPEGAGEWVVKQLPNRFASLDESLEIFQEYETGQHFPYKFARNYGKCEVILYSQDHTASFGTLSHENITALINLWIDRYVALSRLPEPGIQYPFIMENRGEAVGNSMTHPHGQIFAFPFLPPKIEREFQAFQAYQETHGECLLCQILKEELHNPVRIIEENLSFIAEIPYYAHWAFEIHIVSKRHVPSIAEMTAEEVSDLGLIMKAVVRRYDRLYNEGKKNTIMPYVMAMHNAPVNIENRDTWHFHIEYYTPFRGQQKTKFLAGVELGTHLFISDALPEDNAKILRELPL